MTGSIIKKATNYNILKEAKQCVCPRPTYLRYPNYGLYNVLKLMSQKSKISKNVRVLNTLWGTGGQGPSTCLK